MEASNRRLRSSSVCSRGDNLVTRSWQTETWRRQTKYWHVSLCCVQGHKKSWHWCLRLFMGILNTPGGWFPLPAQGCRLWCSPQPPARPPPAGQTRTDAACRPGRRLRPPVSPAGCRHLNAAQSAYVRAHPGVTHILILVPTNKTAADTLNGLFRDHLVAEAPPTFTKWSNTRLFSLGLLSSGWTIKCVRAQYMKVNAGWTWVRVNRWKVRR